MLDTLRGILSNQLYVAIIAIALFVVGTIVLILLRQKPESDEQVNTLGVPEQTIPVDVTELSDLPVTDEAFDVAIDESVVLASDADNSAPGTLAVIDDTVASLKAAIKDTNTFTASIPQGTQTSEYLYSFETICRAIIQRFDFVKRWSGNELHYDQVIRRVEDVNTRIETLNKQFEPNTYNDFENNL